MQVMLNISQLIKWTQDQKWIEKSLRFICQEVDKISIFINSSSVEEMLDFILDPLQPRAAKRKTNYNPDNTRSAFFLLAKLLWSRCEITVITVKSPSVTAILHQILLCETHLIRMEDIKKPLSVISKIHFPDSPSGENLTWSHPPLLIYYLH